MHVIFPEANQDGSPEEGDGEGGDMPPQAPHSTPSLSSMREAVHASPSNPSAITTLLGEDDEDSGMSMGSSSRRSFIGSTESRTKGRRASRLSILNDMNHNTTMQPNLPQPPANPTAYPSSYPASTAQSVSLTSAERGSLSLVLTHYIHNPDLMAALCMRARGGETPSLARILVHRVYHPFLVDQV